MPTPLQFLHASGIQPLHRRGQNFLVDNNIIKKIISAANIKKTDTIMEIGSGSGELTAQLAARAKKVYAVEIDPHLFEIVDARFRGNDTVILIQDDIRAVPQETFGKKNGSYRVIANIPYHITSHILRKFLEHDPRPHDMILLMQKEVAQRIVARPPRMSLLAVSVQYYADAKILFSVSRNSFFPKPNVDSAVVRLVVKKEFIQKSNGMHNDAVFFFSLVRAAFSAKRKQCAQTIAKKLHVPLQKILMAFQKADIPEKARAQEISVEQWARIARTLSTLRA
jgi:16S rRNA (adenine1518-N6/adenine1519-N6)-dimethyltransferase